MRFVNMQNHDPVEHFESLLEWLDPDRERADAKYAGIRQSLIKIFTWRKASDPESLADETLARVMSRVPQLGRTYVGDPSAYIHAVAKKVLVEHMRRPQRAGSVPETTDTEIQKMYGCFEQCFPTLSPSSRQFVKNYYSKERSKRESDRQDLAEKLGISANQLRVRIYRIRTTLEKCVQACMEQEATI